MTSPRRTERDLSRTDAYAYDLPPEQIARYPTEKRDESRLLCVSPGEGPFEHRRFSELPELLARGDLLVLNESRVLPVRLWGRKPTGAACEIVLLQRLGEEDPPRWEALVRPGSKLGVGRRVVVAPGELEFEVEAVLPGGTRKLRVESPYALETALERFGQVPLPPYLEREEEPVDRIRYQTVFARVPGSAAAPTAGLHFTPELLERIEAMGVQIARVLLHVGIGTFRPVEAERIEDHSMHREFWQVPPGAAQAISDVRNRGGRIWAVGTTVVRTLEAWAASWEGGPPEGFWAPGQGETQLFIRPGYRFRVVEGLLTNFHLPRSTLLMLVCALAGPDRILPAYEVAVHEGYRFFSYGDAMAVLPPTSANAS